MGEGCIMKKLLLAVIVLLLSTSGIAAGQVKSIDICTTEWEYYTQKDGKGLYHELWKDIFESAGVKLNIKYHPFKRCEKVVRNVTLKQYDAYPAGYPAAGVTVPKWHIGVDLMTVIYKKGTIVKWMGQASLENRRVAWERGFDLDKAGVIKVKVEIQEFSKLENAMKMLVNGRIDFILDYIQATRDMVKKLDIADQVEILPDVIGGFKYYMIFRDTERGKELAEIWDKGMERLHTSGQLHKMYEQYEDLAY